MAAKPQWKGRHDLGNGIDVLLGRERGNADSTHDGKHYRKQKEEREMTNEEPKVADRGRYSTTETAKLLGIGRTTLYKYANAGLIKCGYRRTNNRPFFEGREILRLWRAKS